MRLFRKSALGPGVFGIWLVSRFVAAYAFLSNTPPLLTNQYFPFLKSYLSNPTLDPWSQWLEVGGQTEAFPYGWAVLILMSGAFYFGDMASSGALGILILYLALDFASLLGLSKDYGQKSSRLWRSTGFFYSIAPAPLIVLAVSGSNDFIPTAFVYFSALYLTRGRVWIAGILLGMAVGAKILLAVAVLAAITWAFRASFPGFGKWKFFLATLISVVISTLPFFYSPGLRRAVASSSDAIVLLTWGIQSPAGTLLLLPTLMAGSFLLIWQVKRMNRELLILSIATPLLVLGGVPGAPVGWSLWSLPFLSILLTRMPLRVIVFSLASLGVQVLAKLGDYGRFLEPSEVSELYYSATSTASFLATLVVIGLLWREYVVRNDFVRLRKRPALVLIAGDSSVGKDTLAAGIIRILGPESCTHVSGDDYHSWDRGNKSWELLTHLNPAANELHHFFNSILTLASGQAVSWGRYEHLRGRRLSPVKTSAKQFVIASGLHALWAPDINSLASLRVYLSMSEELRLDLKMRRDVELRGHSTEAVLQSENRRRADFDSFISPQQDNADVRIHTSLLATAQSEMTVPVIEVTSQVKVFDQQLLSELAHTCGLETRYSNNSEGLRTIEIIGESASEMLSLAFERIEPEMARILGPSGQWTDGGAGIVQFISLIYLSNALRRERLIA